MSYNYCPAIHNGLSLDFKTNSHETTACHCCLRDGFFTVDINTNFWKNSKFIPLRMQNLNDVWDPGCNNCKQSELHGSSLRLGLLSNYGIETTLPGPRKIDLLFDNSCNLACRTCGPEQSTYWQQHLKSAGLRSLPVTVNHRVDDVITALKHIDLSNLKELAFAGGETLLGNNYWRVADVISDLVPNAKENLTITFQSNGTQSINPVNFKIIEKFRLVKINFSLDGIEKQFEYLRWPAKWDDTIENIKSLILNLPSNVMFNIEETVSVFNLINISKHNHFYQSMFPTNREGDVINYNTHPAGGVFSLLALTNEYVDCLPDYLRPTNFIENTLAIESAIKTIKQFDQYRGQRFEDFFPELTGFYSRYL